MKKKKKQLGKHFDNNKAPVHLIPEEAIIWAAEAFGYGNDKYGEEYNYRRGIEYTKLTDSLLRHTLEFTKNIDLDKESKLHHAKHMAANVMMLIYQIVNHPELDNRYKGRKKS